METPFDIRENEDRGAALSHPLFLPRIALIFAGKIGKLIANAQLYDEYLRLKKDFDTLSDQEALLEGLLRTAMEESVAHLAGGDTAFGACNKLSAAITAVESLQSAIKTKCGNIKAYTESLKGDQIKSQQMSLIKDIDDALDYFEGML